MSAIEPPEELLSAYLDGEVTEDERALVEARLSESAEWRAVLEEVRGTRDLLQGLPTRDAPDGFWDAMLAANDPAPEQAAPAVVSIESARHRRTKRIVAWGAGVAAAAAVVAVLLVPSQSEVKPSVATFVNQHAVRSSVTEEPVSQLAPVTKPVRLR
jgi:anti-sigma factor RsiW